MFISRKAAFVRNFAAAAVNGSITLILLLIAPLGLAAVIFNTILVTLSTFFVCAGGDVIASWLITGYAPEGFGEGRYRRINNELEAIKSELRRRNNQ